MIELATRDGVPVKAVAPDDIAVTPKGRLLVEQVSVARQAVTLTGRRPGSEAKSRISHSFIPEATVTVVADDATLDALEGVVRARLDGDDADARGTVVVVPEGLLVTIRPPFGEPADWLVHGRGTPEPALPADEPPAASPPTAAPAPPAVAP